jgi:peptide deformylase
MAQRSFRPTFKLEMWENNPILRKKSLAVSKITPEIIDFAEELMEHMRWYDGVWLAAPQVGRNVRIIATSQRTRKWKDMSCRWETIMVNPEIIKFSEDTIIESEWCLSLPGYIANVKRPRKIKVKYQDLLWRFHTENYEDFDAIVIQHEIDHLDWILYIDKMIKWTMELVE